MPILTNHKIGEKRVLFSNDDSDSAVTQIAQTKLVKDDKVEEHLHPTMDEHFIIISGICEICVGGKIYECCSGSYLYVPEGLPHSIMVKEDVCLITIGIAKDVLR